MSRAVLALGSNVGDRAAALRFAIDRLAATDRLRLVAVSPVYETAPVGPPQPDYFNAVVLVETELEPQELLATAKRVENDAGRRPRERWGPRELDVDVITVDEVALDGDLVLPHPRAHERAFVLVPWLDIDPAAQLPGRGAVRDLVAALDRAGVQRRDDVALVGSP